MQFTESTDVIDLLTNGLSVFSFCVDSQTILSSTLQTSSLFAGGLGSSKYVPFIGSKVPSVMLAHNVAFLESFMQITLHPRVITDVVISPRNFQSGDLLLLRRLDGMDPFLMVSTGGHVAHAAVLLKEDDQMYVLES